MARADRRRARRTLTLLLAGLFGLTACSDAAPALPAPAHREPAPRIDRYVALGDSYTAAPLVPVTDLADGCFRSDSNYPRLVAARLRADLTDVSCSGADTADVIRRPQHLSYGGEQERVPPQIRAVGARTDLVTVGIGGNDQGLFRTLVETCTDAAGADCGDLVDERLGGVGAALTQVGRHVTRVLRTVARRAPKAEVLLVGYPRLVSEGRSCRALPADAPDREFLGGVEKRLAGTLAAAADRAGAGFVDMYSLSKGHEVCSKDPWVNGRTTDQRRAVAFHPFAEGQDAVADAVMSLLAPSSS